MPRGIYDRTNFKKPKAKAKAKSKPKVKAKAKGKSRKTTKPIPPGMHNCHITNVAGKGDKLEIKLSTLPSFRACVPPLVMPVAEVPREDQIVAIKMTRGEWEKLTHSNSGILCWAHGFEAAFDQNRTSGLQGIQELLRFNAKIKDAIA